MSSVMELLNQYTFFQERPGFQIHEIQNYGRRSKFLVTYQEEAFLVIIKESRIFPYLSRLNILGEDYRKLIEFRYLSDDNRVLVLNYYGGVGGHDLSYYAHNQVHLSPQIFAKCFYHLIEDLHSISASYIDFDAKGENWYEFICTCLSQTLDESLQFGAITPLQKNLIFHTIEKNKDYFLNVPTCYIHGDLTIVNVCYHPEKDLLYLIDFDDFIIGDPFYDFSRIMNFANDSEVLKEFKKMYFPNIEENIIHVIYTLRVTLNWYNFILKRNLDYELPVQEINDLIKRLENVE